MTLKARKLPMKTTDISQLGKTRNRGKVTMLHVQLSINFRINCWKFFLTTNYTTDCCVFQPANTCLRMRSHGQQQ